MKKKVNNLILKFNKNWEKQINKFKIMLKINKMTEKIKKLDFHINKDIN